MAREGGADRTLTGQGRSACYCRRCPELGPPRLAAWRNPHPDGAAV